MSMLTRGAIVGAAASGFALATWFGQGSASAEPATDRSPSSRGPVKVAPRPAPTVTRTPTPARRAAGHPVAKSVHLSAAASAHPVADLLKRWLFNEAPVASVMGPGHRLDNGQIWDSGLGVDPEGDPIGYTVSGAPQYGTVSVSDAGVYTYTPGADFTGVDTFTVAMRDLGNHINLLDLFGSRESAAVVTVRSGAVDETGEVVDEFDGPAGSRPDPGLWNIAVGTGWDASQARYSNSPDNVRLDGQGHLIIQAQNSLGRYTSGYIHTKDKLEMMYGTLTARIKFPAGQGMWPAFWMLGSTFDRETWNATDATGWPGCGEIDIMELANTATTYHVTLHGPNVAGGDFYGDAYWLSVGTSGPIDDLSESYHDYWVRRQPDLIVVGVDDTVLGTFTPASLPPGGQWVFNEPMFAILNLAVGGAWTGPPDATTGWPATMLVDSFTYTPAG